MLTKQKLVACVLRGVLSRGARVSEKQGEDGSHDEAAKEKLIIAVFKI